jgi:transposase
MGRKKKDKPKVVDIDVNEIEEIIAATKLGPLTEEQHEKLLQTMRLLFQQIQSGKARPKDSAKLERVLKALAKAQAEREGKVEAQTTPSENSGKGKKPGHGRNGAAKFAGAIKVKTSHPELKKGDPCPSCPPGKTGKVYRTKKPNVLIRLVGMAPIQATIYEMENLRCNLCGASFTAPTPEGVGDKKYDESVVGMLAVLKYGSGMPRNRLAGLQGRLGIPLPQPTQWELLKAAADSLKALLNELLYQAAQGDVLHNDDTSMKILNIERPEDKSTRTGIFTSTVVSTSSADAPRIALFFTGWQHAGENLADVLKERREELATPTRMGDAASRNRPKDEKGEPMPTDKANCLAHGRQYIVNVYENFPDESLYFLDELSTVFLNEKTAKKQKLNPQQRLEFHQEHSGPVMDRLWKWMGRQFEEKLVEPNSALGEAIKHLKKNWEPLTLFLRKPGAPIENNIAERAMKKAVLNRKNAHFYRNQNGADVGDLFMSLIHTCELNEVNPFDYLTQALRNAGKITAENAADWMPWSYKAQLAS